MKFADEKSANRSLNDAQHDHKFLLGEADTLFQTAAQLKELADSLAANDSPRALEIKMRYAETQRAYTRFCRLICYCKEYQFRVKRYIEYGRKLKEEAAAKAGEAGNEKS